jgi:hypothetical protein
LLPPLPGNSASSPRAATIGSPRSRGGSPRSPKM